MTEVRPFRAPQTWPAKVTVTVQGKAEEVIYLFGSRDEQLRFRADAYQAHSVAHLTIELQPPMPAQMTVQGALGALAQRLR